jgi:hypothetical protein
MPYSYAVYTGNGATTQFTVPFAYIRREHVVVSLNYVSTAFTWVNNTTVQVSPAPANAVRVEVRRVTPVNSPLVDFTDGSTLVAADLDINALQQTYINQEQDDQIQQGIYVDPQGNLTAGNQVLKDLLDPVDPQDAATKNWVETATSAPLVQFRDIFYGAFATDQATDPSGNPPTEGDLYFNSTLDQMRVYNGTSWQEASADATITRFKFTAVGGETSLSGADDNANVLTYNVGLEMVYINGALMTRGVDYVATTGSSITGLTALSTADLVEVLAFSQINAIGSIPGANIADGTITTGKLNDLSVTTGKLADSSVTSGKIADGAIVNADVNASAGIVASKLSFTQAGSGAAARTIDSKLKDVVSVKDFGAVGDGVADDTAAIQAALDAHSNVFVPAGTYLVSSAITLPGGRRLHGDVSTKGQRTSIIQSTSATSVFTTNQTAVSFLGIGISNLRITGGATGNYAISSHYPYTYIDGVRIENVSGSFSGSGIRLHNDGGNSSMGCWGSAIRDCKIVLTQSASNATGIELGINGGNVSVHKTEIIFGDLGINVVSGENFSFTEVNTNRITDPVSTGNPPVKAAFVIGNGTSGFAVKNCVISQCYIEGHDRAVLINNAVNTTVSDCFINDIGYTDPVTKNVTNDGCIYHTSYASNTKIVDCYIEVRYTNQYHVLQFLGSNYAGVAVDNCYLFTSRGAATMNKGNRPFFDTKEDGCRNTIYKSTVSSVTENRTILGNEASFSTDATFVNGTPQTIFTIQGAQVWEVIVNQHDSNARFTLAYVSRPNNGSSPVVSTLVAGASTTVTLSTNDVQVTQSSGINRRLRVVWRLLTNAA